MAIIYVDSAAAGSNNGTSWANAYTSIASATTAAAGDFVYIDDGHSQTFASTTTVNFSSGTIANPVKIICVDKAADTLSTGAVLQVTDSGVSLRLQGFIFCRGITITHERDLQLGNIDRQSQSYEHCVFNSTFATVTTGALLNIGINFRPGFISFHECTFTIAHAGNSPHVFAHALFSKCTFSATATNVFRVNGENVNTVEVRDSDLSSIAALFSYISANQQGDVKITRCSLNASYTLPTAQLISKTAIEHSDDGTITVPPLGLAHYRVLSGDVKSTLAQYRTGGADDGVQVNAYSFEMVTTASSLELYKPLEITLGQRWVGPKSSISGATAKGIFTSYRAAPLATPAALTTDAVSTWTGTGVGTKQKIDHTLSNGDTLTVYVASGVTLENDEFWIEVSEPDQVAGLVTVKAFLAKPSTTVYVDPKISVA